MTQQFCTYTAHVAFPAHNGLIILTQKSSINACASQAVCAYGQSGAWKCTLPLKNVFYICTSVI